MLLPTILLLVAVLALLAGSVTSMTTGGAMATRQTLESERAMRLADAGLASATARLMAGTLGAALTEPVDEGRFEVAVVSNPGAMTMATTFGLDLPPRSTLLRSVGITRSGAQRTSLALFRNGLGAFQVGALADSMSAADSTFDAYNSATNPVPTLLPGQGILATNYADGLHLLSLNNSAVAGSALVGPGGDTGTQIVVAGTSSVVNKSQLTTPIVIPPITVPDVATARPDVGGPAPAAAAPRTVIIRNNGGSIDTTVSPPTRSSDPVTFSHYCLTVQVWPDGRYFAEESGSGSKLRGTFTPGGTPTEDWRQNNGLHATGPGLNLTGVYHKFSYDPGAQSFTIDRQEGAIRAGDYGTPMSPSLPDWAYFVQPEPESDDASTLPEGRYNNVSLTQAQAELVDNGTYVMRNLQISGNGKLHLAAGAKNVKIYVTGSLRVDGLGAIANDSLLPSNLKIFYTGNQPVQLSDGSASYFTLFAPGAEVTLTGHDSEFYGALVTKKLSLSHAHFHYDTATRGVGTGEDATAFTLLARYRL